MRCMGEVERLDTTLASLAREEGALRLRLGQLLEVLGRGAVFDLGFSSLGAYAVERCERSVRWVEAARCLARRAEALPELRRAIAMGKLSWTMGEVLARVATPVDEARWLALAESRTVRQVQCLVADAVSAARAADTMKTDAPALASELPVEAVTAPEAAELANRASGDGGELCTLTCTVDREDAWLFEATRCLLDQLGERGMAAQSEALLAEGQGTLLALLPCGAIDVGCFESVDVAQQRWVEQLRRWRAEAEVLCEKNILGALAAARAPSLEVSVGHLAIAASLGIAPLQHATCVVLDQQVRSVSAALARHELELSRRVLQFHRADGWRRRGTPRRHSTRASDSACRARASLRGERSRCGSRSCLRSRRRSARTRSEWRQRCTSCASRPRRPKPRGSSGRHGAPSNICAKKSRPR